jgi:integrase
MWPREIKKGNARVKVYRVAHSTNKSGWAYVVAWHSSEGRKTQKFADEREALREAELKAANLNAGRVSASSMTAEDRQELLAARELAGDTPLLTALREWRASRTPAGAGLTVADAVKQFLAHKKSVGVNTKAGYDRTMPALLEAHGTAKLHAISLAQLETYLARFAHPTSRNTHRRRIVALFRWARKRGLLPLDTLTAAERTDTAQEPRVTIGLITAAELAQAYVEVRRAKPEYVPALVLASACGMRRAEVHAQTWEDIDLERAFVRVTKAKPRTPARRMVPLTAPAVIALRGYRSDDGKGPVCTNLAIDRIRDICRTAGLDLADNGFRHSWISARVAVTSNINETSIEAGNTPTILHRHYRELMRREEAEAWFALPQSASLPTPPAPPDRT